MKKIFDDIIRFDALNQTVFYEDIFKDDDEEKGFEKEFLSILKKLDKDYLEKFLMSYPDHVREWFKNEIDKIEQPSEEFYNKSCKVITEIFGKQEEKLSKVYDKIAQVPAFIDSHAKYKF